MKRLQAFYDSFLDCARCLRKKLYRLINCHLKKIIDVFPFIFYVEHLQRVKLAYFIAQDNIDHTLFIFDEPTTGLHFHDIDTLLKSLNALIDKGHTVIIIEHNMDMIKSADWIIDIGPEGGETGGRVVAEGTPEQIADSKTSYTAKYLKPKLTIAKDEKNR